MDKAENFAFYRINTIANYDPSILSFLEMSIGSEFERQNDSEEFKLIDENKQP